MSLDFRQSVWDGPLEASLHQLLQLAVGEDLGRRGDCTSLALVAEDARGRAAVVVRRPGVIAGLEGGTAIVEAFDRRLVWTPQARDGDTVATGQCVARLHGPARGLLAAERTLLNILGRLSGIATLARRYVEAVAGTGARIYDTRKTTPGWRRLEKYAVRCGGACNHRTGLFDAVLIKDNHLALGGGAKGGARFSPAQAVRRARRFLAGRADDFDQHRAVVEIEVDTLEQLDAVLPAEPDLVLLDNMTPSQLGKAVSRRDAVNRSVQLEASGGVSLESVRAIATSGVDRISVGALTHSAVALDLGLDWLSAQ